MSQNLAQRSVTSVKWNAAGTIAQLVLGFVQTTVLARLLPVETFGVYAAAVSVVTLTGTFASFGLGGAFLHRTTETEELERSAALHFTLKTIFTVIWATLLIAGVFVFSGSQQVELRTAFLAVAACEIIRDFTQTPQLILVRQVRHRRLAVLQVLDTALATIITILLAAGGATLWALLANNIVQVVVYVVGFYIWRPVWRPRFAWSAGSARYFIRFGSRNLLAQFLLSALDRVDDIWTGAFLGAESLGFYSRAYRFAKLPSGILANPVNSVATGTYAELKGDRQNLSLAFNRVNILMARSGFFIAGILALVAPEFIRIVLGEKWLPMLDAFRLMLIFSLFDPMKQTIANLFIAGVGKPEVVVQVRSVQMGAMLAGLFLLGPPLGIVGVALAVDLMLVLGIALTLWRARKYVDFSIAQLFAMPAIAVFLALLLGSIADTWNLAAYSDWLSGSVKALVFLVVFAAVLIAFDRPQLNDMTRIIRQYLLGRSKNLTAKR